MKGEGVVHSSGNDEWRTPRWLYDRLDALFHFGLDAAATDESHLAPAYFTPKDDALKHSWRGYGNVFLNPPYSRKANADFMEKVVSELDGTFAIVVLIASKTSVPWWHTIVMPYVESIAFIKGRLRFEGAPNDAPFPSCICVFCNPTPRSSCLRKGSTELYTIPNRG